MEDMHRNNKKNRILFASLSFLLILLFIADIVMGSVVIPLRQLFEALFSTSGSTETVSTILFDFRIPKAITAIVAGIALSISGLQMQTVFRNPLAGPYVLGISAGASLAVALFAMGFPVLLAGGFPWAGTWSVALVAWMGSFLVMFLVLGVSTRVNDNMTLLILGMLFTGGVSAVVTILQYYSSESLLKAFMVWTMGSLGTVTHRQLWVVVPAILVGVMIAFLKLKDLNAYLLGETYARALGVNIRTSRLVIFSGASLMAGTITAFCGPIGFIGIAVPHLSRVLFRSADHRILIPATVIIGADVMLLSDIIAQLPGLQTTLPINSVTALLGIPVVIWMIIRNKKFSPL
jgi:iron complex transport system permease protein